MSRCKNCGSIKVFGISMKTEELTVCVACGYGYPSGRAPIQYDETYERKYLIYPEEKINCIRLSAVGELSHVGHILDFGCGSGSFVREARVCGLVAYGVDVNDYTKDLRPPADFRPDVITAWDSFEHLTDEEQTQFFKMAESVKAVIVSVPDFSPVLTGRIAVDKWRHYRPNEHLHYYTYKALCEQFTREGFAPVFYNHNEDLIRKAPWSNNILTVGFVR